MNPQTTSAELYQDPVLTQEREVRVETQSGDQIITDSLADIHRVETQVTTELGIMPNTPEAVQATDEALADIADYTLNSPDADITDRQDVLLDVLIETADEMGSGATPDQTALAKFGVDKPGHLEAIKELEKTLNETHATLPSGHEAGPLVEMAVAELSSHAVMEAPGVTEIQAMPETEKQPELAEYFESVKERAEVMAERAIERSDYTGPKVEGAIKGFYSDHETFLAIVGKLAGSEGKATLDYLSNEESRQGLIENKDMASLIEDVVKKMASPDVKGQDVRRMLDMLTKVPYTEPSVGLLSLSEADIDQIVEEKTAIMDTLRVNLHDDELRGPIERQIETTKKEVRHAGQLLFHNTMYGGHVSSAGKLQGRDRQQTANGVVHQTTNDGDAHHSSVIHWSEGYDPYSYKIRMGDNNTEGSQAMTVAVPIGEVVKRAPYARGLAYTVVQSKEGRDPGVQNLADIRPIVDIGPGAMDSVGKQLSIDRAFFADPDSYDAATDYEVPVSGREVMQEDAAAGLEMPVTYYIQSEVDQLNSADHNARNGRYEPNAGLWREQPSAAVVAAAQSIIGADSGAGYGYPNRVVVKDLGLDDHPGSIDNVSPESRIQATQNPPIEPIVKAQHESVDRFKGQYVVPLRAEGSDDLYVADARIDSRFKGGRSDELDRLIQGLQVQESYYRYKES